MDIKYINYVRRRWFALQGKADSVFVTTGDNHDGEMRRRWRGLGGGPSCIFDDYRNRVGDMKK
jgi:hypothetical protein